MIIIDALMEEPDGQTLVVLVRITHFIVRNGL
jgi:hypothetical protein